MLEEYKNIIVRMPNWLGDIVMATPVLEDLRRKYPKARITAMCQESCAKLLEHNPFIDNIFIYKRPKNTFLGRGVRDVIDNIRCGNYDLGVLLTNSFSSAFWFWKAGVEYSLGYEGNMRRVFLDKPLPFPPSRHSQHLVKTYKQVLAPLGISLSEHYPRLYITGEEERDMDALLDRYGVSNEDMLIGINPSAAYGEAKCWLPERFVFLVKRLLENPKVKVCLVGDQKGKGLVTEIYEKIGSENVYNFAGNTTLRQLATLINRCNLFITNDSGPMHMAAALRVPLLALFGSTNEITTGPYKFGDVIHKHADCSPCYKRSCPRDFRCMNAIAVEDVYEKAFKILNHLEQ